MPVAILLATAPAKIFSLPTGWAMVIMQVCVVLAMVAGLFEVHTVEFTEQRVRLVSNARTRIRDVTDLESVEIVHSGNTEDGYTQTSLRLTWSGSHRGSHTIDDNHDAALAHSLTRVLGTRLHMSERWKTLEPPPPEA
ncbi:hypothetical protein [Streptomyces flaveus]|uniref:Uncharacterized protein n=1 Tax=Streptomyces flaveus TaxID=66370 RepID=A0A917QG07_9ACTN|nr:hypothetical protein [Streptomyces flaveus]GGK48151.1 hypothetical protein GCM10010094_05350 [Streptomyces flaveus]